MNYSGPSSHPPSGQTKPTPLTPEPPRPKPATSTTWTIVMCLGGLLIVVGAVAAVITALQDGVGVWLLGLAVYIGGRYGRWQFRRQAGGKPEN